MSAVLSKSQGSVTSLAAIVHAAADRANMICKDIGVCEGLLDKGSLLQSVEELAAAACCPGKPWHDAASRNPICLAAGVDYLLPPDGSLAFGECPSGRHSQHVLVHLPVGAALGCPDWQACLCRLFWPVCPARTFW